MFLPVLSPEKQFALVKSLHEVVRHQAALAVQLALFQSVERQLSPGAILTLILHRHTHHPLFEIRPLSQALPVADALFHSNLQISSQRLKLRLHQNAQKQVCTILNANAW